MKSKLMPKQSYIVKLKKGNSIDFNTEIDSIGEWIYGKDFWDRMMKSPDKKGIDRQRKETKHIFKRKGKEGKKAYLEWRDNKPKENLAPKIQLSPDEQQETIRQRKDPFILPFKEQIEVAKLQDKTRPQHKEEVKKSLTDRIGDKGIFALQFMNENNNNLISSGYLSEEMADYIGKLGDDTGNINKYKSFIKYPKRTKYDKLVTTINSTYGTKFRNRYDIAAFQDMMGLTVDGIVGPQTEAALQYYYGQQKKGDSNDFYLVNTDRMYANKANHSVYNETISNLSPGGYWRKVQESEYPFREGFNAPLSMHRTQTENNNDAYADWAKYYSSGDFDNNVKATQERIGSENFIGPYRPFQGTVQNDNWSSGIDIAPDSDFTKYILNRKVGGLIPKPNYLNKLNYGMVKRK